MKRPTILRYSVLFLTFAMLVILLGCNSASTEISTPGALPAETDAPLVTSVATDMPTATPTAPAGLVILLIPAEADEQQAATLQTMLAELAAQEGLRFETRQAVQPGELDTSVRLVVVLAPDPGVQNLASASPAIQFLAVGMPGLSAGSNISLIGAQGGRPDRQGFLAGYLAALVTADWRVGVISRSDTPAGLAARKAFLNGAVFFCGLCRPAYPPFNQYPLFAELAVGAGQAEQQAAADALISSAVKTVYIVPGAGDDFLLQYLAQAGINLIAGVPTPAELQGQWVATLGFDLAAALRQAWPDLLAGKGGLEFEPPLTIENINPAILTTGRQRLVERTRAELEAGYIDTGVDPLTGEMR